MDCSEGGTDILALCVMLNWIFISDWWCIDGLKGELSPGCEIEAPRVRRQYPPDSVLPVPVDTREYRAAFLLLGIAAVVGRGPQARRRDFGVVMGTFWHRKCRRNATSAFHIAPIHHGLGRLGEKLCRSSFRPPNGPRQARKAPFASPSDLLDLAAKTSYLVVCSR